MPDRIATARQSGEESSLREKAVEAFFSSNRSAGFQEAIDAVIAVCMEEAAKALDVVADALWERCEMSRPEDAMEVGSGEKEDATTAWCFQKAAAHVRTLDKRLEKPGKGE